MILEEGKQGRGGQAEVEVNVEEVDRSSGSSTQWDAAAVILGIKFSGRSRRLRLLEGSRARGRLYIENRTKDRIVNQRPGPEEGRKGKEESLSVGCLKRGGADAEGVPGEDRIRPLPDPRKVGTLNGGSREDEKKRRRGGGGPEEGGGSRPLGKRTFAD